MDFVISFFFLLGGALLSAWGMSQIFFSLCVAIPMHCKIHKQKAIQFKNAMLASIATILIWIILISIASFLVITFSSVLSTRMFFGAFSVVTIIVLCKSGKSQANIQDYFKSFRGFIDPQKIDILSITPDNLN